MSLFRYLVSRCARGAALLVVLGATAEAALAAGKLWIVSPTGCPGVHFAEIQPAVDAAADGDVVLVRGRNDGNAYASFVVIGKSLAIVSDGLGPTPVFSSIRIENLGPAQSILLQGIDPGPIAFGETELVLVNNQGPIWIDACVLQNYFLGNPAVTVTNTASALFSRCTVSGTLPGEGLVVSNSLVHLYDSSVAGGDGWVFLNPLPGKEGIRVEANAVVFLIGTTVRGGGGAPGAPCAEGGPGLDALVLNTPTSYALSLDATLVPGAGGPGGRICNPLGGGCICQGPDGPPGNELSGPGLRVPLAGTARSFVSTSPVREHEWIFFSFTGEEGDLAVLFDSFAQQHIFWPQLNGVLGPALPGFAPFNGFIPASGTLDASGPMTAAAVDPGEAAVLYAQGLFLDPLGVIYIGAPFAWVILDENHDPRDGCP